MSRHAPRPRPADGGIVSILGAILLAGLALGAIVVYQLAYVPVLEENREAEHMERLGAQLAGLKTELDLQLKNRTLVPSATTIGLGPHRTAGSGGVGSGQLLFTPGERGATLFIDRLFSPPAAGEPIPLLPEPEWRSAGDGPVTGITRVHDLRLRTDPVQKSQIPAGTVQPTPATSLNVSVHDASGRYAGALIIYGVAYGPVRRRRGA